MGRRNTRGPRAAEFSGADEYHRCVARGGGQGGFLRRVACQVLPSIRLGKGAQAPDAPIDKFRDWRENTNSIFCEDHSLLRDSKWKSGYLE
jgi:hypothetical protein